MEALVPAVVAALLAGIGEKSAALAARLAGWRLAGLLVIQAIVIAIAVAGGALVAPLLNPEARTLIVAVALAFAGAAALVRVGKSDGPVAVALVSAVATAFADSTPFIAFALAARGPSPIAAGIGALIGTIALAMIAAVLGEQGWRSLPMRALNATTGALLLVVGLWIGAAALRLT